jgi:hypothetical protein
MQNNALLLEVDANKKQQHIVYLSSQLIKYDRHK